MYRASHGGDPYPGTENQFNATSFPMNKGTLTKALLNIQETGGIVTFDFMEESAITQTIPLPAPVPEEESDNVYNITSNQYSHASVMVNRNSTTTLIEKVQLADGDDAFRLTDFVSMSTGFTDLFSLADCNTVHVDFYPLEDMEIAISLLGPESTSNAKTISLTANQWNSVDIPLADLLQRAVQHRRGGRHHPQPRPWPDALSRQRVFQQDAQQRHRQPEARHHYQQQPRLQPRRQTRRDQPAQPAQGRLHSEQQESGEAIIPPLYNKEVHRRQTPMVHFLFIFSKRWFG